MSPAEIQKHDQEARRGFTYKADGKIDEWLSHADDVKTGKPYQDDCDGLASTAVDLCCRAGLPEDRAFRLAVAASSDGSGHMVAAVMDDAGHFWVIGDTFRSAYAAERMLHKPIEYRRLSESAWREGAPWSVQSLR